MQNNITDKEYNKFMEDCWLIAEKDPDINKLFSDVAKRNKFRQAKFFANLFVSWKQNRVEWFLNSEVLKHADK